MADEPFDPKSDKTMGYHLFLEPEGGLAARLKGIIEQLAQAYGGPVFAPHVTLLARIPAPDESTAIKHAKAVAAVLSPQTLTLGLLASEDSYYRALYSQIREQDEMRACHARASELFGTELNPAYLAHLSLFYGIDLPPGTIGNAAADVPPLEGMAFTADRIHLYRTEGVVGEWHEVGVFPFGANA